MERLTFMGLGTLMAAAAAYQGNPIAGLLSLAAVVLTFVVIGPRTSLSRPPHFVRGREERKRIGRASRMLAQPRRTLMHQGNASKVAQQVEEATSELVQMGIVSARALGADAMYIGCKAALGGLIPVAMVVADKKNIPRNEDEVKARHNEIALSLVTPETMVFVALLTSRILVEIVPKTGNVTTEMNPYIIYEAVRDFEKLTGKKAEDYLDPGLCRAAREAAESGEGAFREFMKKKGSVPNVPNTLN